MSKFKVGDKVRLIYGTRGNEAGDICEIIALDNHDANWCYIRTKTHGSSGTYCDRKINPPYAYMSALELELVPAPDRHELHITSDGTTTNAVYKLNGKVTKQAKAVCCPSDTFNFNVGAELATNRALYGTDYNPKYVTPPPMTIAAEPEQPKEPIMLYCVKDYVNIFGEHALHKGKIYEFDGHRVNYDEIKCAGFKSFESWKVRDPDYSACLIRAEKRAAKLGEYVVLEEEWYEQRNNVPEKRPYKVIRVDGDLAYLEAEEMRNAWSKQYLVLPDYTPEKVEPTFLNMKVVCIEPKVPFLTKGKVYTFKNGLSVDDTGETLPYSEIQITTLEMLNERPMGKFIEYRGEQSC